MPAGRDKRFAGGIALETAKLLRRHDDLIAPVHRNKLRPFGADTPHELAETRLGVVKGPMARRMRPLI